MHVTHNREYDISDNSSPPFVTQVTKKPKPKHLRRAFGMPSIFCLFVEPAHNNGLRLAKSAE